MSRPLRADRITGLLVVGMVLVGSHQLVDAALIKSKAELAQVLIGRAWESSLASGVAVRPWPWADTWPVAKLRLPQRNIELTVLHGATGNALAFGPGHEVASAEPGSRGLSVIAGHRDTHFAFMGELDINDPITLQSMDGIWRRYRITRLQVIDADAVAPPDTQSSEGLLLVTCFPLDAVRPGGSLRYLAFAEPEPALAAAPTIPATRSYQL